MGMYPEVVSSATPPPPPLTPAGFQVLLAIASGRTHGYAIMSFIHETTGGAVQMGPGTLYRTIARLVGDRLVVETSQSDPDAPHDDQRRYYTLTERGRQAAAKQAAVLARFVETAAEAGLLPAPEYQIHRRSS